jgi:antitoxin (DNA-binding transcriptional repressor) of toxin-antitoxin stability system
MAYYSLEDAIARLPELLAKATEGEEVIITRLDEDLVKLVPTEPRPMTKEEVDWLRDTIVTPREPIDAVALVRQMRDEGA